MKLLLLSSAIMFFALTSCKISGTYKWAKLNTRLNPDLIKKLDSTVADPNLKYSRFDVFEPILKD